MTIYQIMKKYHEENSVHTRGKYKETGRVEES